MLSPEAKVIVLQGWVLRCKVRLYQLGPGSAQVEEGLVGHRAATYYEIHPQPATRAFNSHLT